MLRGKVWGVGLGEDHEWFILILIKYIISHQCQVCVIASWTGSVHWKGHGVCSCLREAISHLKDICEDQMQINDKVYLFLVSQNIL